MASVTTTTVPWAFCQRAVRGTGCASATASRTAAPGCVRRRRSMSASPARGGGDHVLGAAAPGRQVAGGRSRRPASGVRRGRRNCARRRLAKSAGVQPGRDVFDSKLLPDTRVGGEGHADHTRTRGVQDVELSTRCELVLPTLAVQLSLDLDTTESYPLPAARQTCRSDAATAAWSCWPLVRVGGCVLGQTRRHAAADHRTRRGRGVSAGDRSRRPAACARWPVTRRPRCSTPRPRRWWCSARASGEQATVTVFAGERTAAGRPAARPGDAR